MFRAPLLAVLLLSLPSAAAGQSHTHAAEPVLETIARGARPCTQLRVSYSEPDRIGGSVSVRIDALRVEIVKTRLGLPDRRVVGQLSRKACRALAGQLVASRAWQIKVGDPTGLGAAHNPTVRVHVPGASFSGSVPQRTLARFPSFGRLRVHLLAVAHRSVRPRRAVSTNRR